MQIFVKLLNGTTVTLNVDICDTTEYVKQIIEDHENIPSSKQRLTCGGNQLENGKNLCFYDIKNNSTLHLSLRLQGGKQMSKKEFKASIRPFRYSSFNGSTCQETLNFTTIHLQCIAEENESERGICDSAVFITAPTESSYCKKLKKRTLRLLAEYKLSPNYDYFADSGALLHMKLDSYKGLCEAVLTVYSSDEKSTKTKKPFHIQFNKQCREVLEYKRTVQAFKYATEWFMIDHIFKLKKKLLKHAIYRGITSKTSFQEGDRFQFSQFSSFSKVKGIAAAFSDIGGTIFIIKEGSAMSVRPYSLFKTEMEYLIHPFTTYVVKAVIVKHCVTEVILHEQHKSK